MKRILKAIVIGVFLSAGQSALADSFPAAAESNVGQGALDTYADRHEREGTLLLGSGSAYPKAAEESIGQGARETYAGKHMQHGELLGSAESPFPISADA